MVQWEVFSTLLVFEIVPHNVALFTLFPWSLAIYSDLLYILAV